MSEARIAIIGAGLSGVEAALTLAKHGQDVTLIEQKPRRQTEASRSDDFAELVCSNSLRAADGDSAVGRLKLEMAKLDSFFMKAAYETKLPAGGALAVDRERFSKLLTDWVHAEPRIDVVEQVVDEIPVGFDEVMLATGPLTSGGLSDALKTLTGEANLHFYDAIAPIIDADSLDMDKLFFQSRYDKGDSADYLNIPLSESEYRAFIAAMNEAETTPAKPFEKPSYFEGCLPIEILASRGVMTPAFGPMKPVGLTDPKTGERPFAAVQLRAENEEKSAFSLVGFQTRLIHPEQMRLFRMLPGLQHAEFLRLGSAHRNSFVNAPVVLDERLRLKADKRIRIIGQLSGVEGYVESAAMGLLGALFAAYEQKGERLSLPPAETMLGGLLRYLQTEQKHFQPSNVTHAMIPPLEKKRKGKLPKREKKHRIALRAEEALEAWIRASV